MAKPGQSKHRTVDAGLEEPRFKKKKAKARAKAKMIKKSRRKNR